MVLPCVQLGPKKQKKPTWQNTRRYSTTSAYSLTSPSALPGCSSSSHPTLAHYTAGMGNTYSISCSEQDYEWNFEFAGLVRRFHRLRVGSGRERGKGRMGDPINQVPGHPIPSGWIGMLALSADRSGKSGPCPIGSRSRRGDGTNRPLRPTGLRRPHPRHPLRPSRSQRCHTQCRWLP